MTVSIEIVNFDQELKRIEEEIANLANLKIDERIDYAEKNLKIVTPVDTGKARAGWSSSKKYDKYGFREGLVFNKVDYIDILNKGHSRQAPRYFIEQVLIKIGVITP